MDNTATTKQQTGKPIRHGYKKLKQQLRRWWPVFQLAWPLIIANSFWNLQMTIDRVFLGEYSTLALGASVAVMSLYWTPMALLQQTASYVATFVAQYKGSDRMDMIGPSFWASVYYSLAGGLLFLVFIPMSDWLFSLLGHSAEMTKLESEYFSAICFSALPTALVAAVSGVFTGVGRTQVIMVFNAIGMAFNILFDYLFIFGNLGFPEMGIAGAGYATALSSCCGAIFGLGYLVTRKDRKQWKLLSGWRWDSDLFYRYLKYGVPSGLQWALEGLAFAVFLALVGRLPNGDAALAASSIAVTLLLLAALPGIGIGQAVAVLVGDHIGRQAPEKASRDTWAGFQMATLYIFMVGLSFMFFPSFYLNWFKNDTDLALWNEVVKISPAIFILVAIFMLFDSINFVIGFALKGAGDTRFVFLVAMLTPWPLMVLPTYLVLDMANGLFWGWMGVTVWVIVQDTTYLLRFIGGKWKQMSVLN